jgi:hypothetical protein
MANGDCVGVSKDDKRDAGLSRVTLVLRFVLGPLLLVGILFVAFCVWSFFSYGDVRTGIAVINGFKLVVRDHTLNVGKVPVNESRLVRFHLKNVSSRPVDILGAWADCGCITTDDLPLTVNSHSEIEFNVSLHTDSGMIVGSLMRQVVPNLSVDQPAVVLAVEFEVVGTEKTSDVK